ncbi:MAG: methionyl-tRNA formyltransferase [Candidatus Hydrogenedentes bacterium]|nr:methionyl-tRNA formyltransferase [Candidatus Hydrogenedentota bacterium]
MRIALAGTGRYGARLLKPLIGSRHQVVAVIQDGRRTRGVSRTISVFGGRCFNTHLSPISLALHNKIPVLWIDKMTDEELAPLRALEPDLLLVGGFSIILKRPILELPRLGCVNVHASLLPRHRGPNPFSAVIVANEAETGITFHVMEEGIDTGPILHQAAIAIDPKDTAMGLYRKICDLNADHVLEVMNRIEREGLYGTPQDESLATYEKKSTPDDVTIHWDMSAAEIERLVRACSVALFARFIYRGAPVYVSRVKIDSNSVAAAPGTVLQIKPYVNIAAREGTATILVAYRKPWLWPAPWNRPKIGEILS